MSAVGWRNKRGYVSDRGPTISSVEDSLRSANFSAPDKDKQMALLYTGKGYVFKDQNDMPQAMRLARDTTTH
jgi:hypothetical protein